MKTHTRIITTALACSTLTLIAAPLTGCRGERTDKPPRQFFPDLDTQEKYNPQSESTFFEDGRTQREPVAGTVAFGKSPNVEPIMGIDFAGRDEFLRADDAWSQGRVFLTSASGASTLDENGQPSFRWIETMPVEVTPELLDLGMKNYNIYCLPCHSGSGDGQGLVAKQWSYTLPNFHDDIYQPGGGKGQDGYLFHILRNGVPNDGGPYSHKMQGYGRKLTIEESWAIVAYMRALQATRQGELGDLPEAQRLELERRRTGTATPSDASTTDSATDGGAP